MLARLPLAGLDIYFLDSTISSETNPDIPSLMPVKVTPNISLGNFVEFSYVASNNSSISSFGIPLRVLSEILHRIPPIPKER